MGMITTSLGYSALDIAKWFVNSTDREAGDDITHLKVQKLLYYAQGWSLVQFDKPLFNEAMQAWVHGPVVPSVWSHLKDHGWVSIPLQRLNKRVPTIHAGLLIAINERYGIYTAKKLEKMTHEETPWRRARGNLPVHERCTNVISLEDMKAYFQSVQAAAA